MRNKLSYVISLFIIFTFSSGTKADSHQFSLGIIIPLSGALAEYGTAIRNGFQLAQADHPELFSNVNFIYEDSGYDATTAIGALNNLRITKTIDLYYMWGVSPTEAMLPIADKNELAVIAETTIKEATVGRKYVVRAARTGERIAKSLSDEIKRRGLKQVSLVITQIPFYTDIIRYLESDLKLNGIKITKLQEVLPSETDFKSYIANLKRDNNDAVGLFLLPAQLVNFYRQLKIVKLNVQTFNADLLDSSTIIKECPDTIENAFFTQVGVTEEFRKKYIDFAESDIHIGSAAQSYDVALLIGELFGKVKSKLTTAEIIKTISEISERSGATGAFKYTDTLESGKELRMPVSLKRVRHGKIETIIENTGF